MPSKRTLAIALILIGLLAIGGVLYWTFWSKSAPSFPVAPAPIQPSTPIAPAPQPSSPADSIVAEPLVPSTPSSEDQEQLVLRQRALALAARQGSYTNTDGFASLTEVYVDVTPTVRAFYQGERQRLTNEHPLTAGSWTQTLRTLSSRITSELPLTGKTQAVVVVQAQQVIETGTQPAVLSYREVTLTFTRDQGRWIISRVESKPLEL